MPLGLTSIPKIKNLAIRSLHLAVHYGLTVTVKTLIAAGADVNTKDKSGNTPLNLAAHYGRTKIVESSERSWRNTISS